MEVLGSNPSRPTDFPASKFASRKSVLRFDLNYGSRTLTSDAWRVAPREASGEAVSEASETVYRWFTIRAGPLLAPNKLVKLEYVLPLGFNSLTRFEGGAPGAIAPGRLRGGFALRAKRPSILHETVEIGVPLYSRFRQFRLKNSLDPCM